MSVLTFRDVDNHRTNVHMDLAFKLQVYSSHRDFPFRHSSPVTFHWSLIILSLMSEIKAPLCFTANTTLFFTHSLQYIHFDDSDSQFLCQWHMISALTRKSQMLHYTRMSASSCWRSTLFGRSLISLFGCPFGLSKTGWYCCNKSQQRWSSQMQRFWTF